MPKFVIRNSKKRSLGDFRIVGSPNKLVQDSEKHYMLCKKCEELFSKYEVKFANSIFHPYKNKNVKEFNYDSDIYYFVTSVSWRSLYLDICDFVKDYENIDINILEFLIGKEKEMKEYLLGEKNNIEKFEHHIFFIEDIEEVSKEIKDLRPNVILKSAIASYIFFSNDYKTYGTITFMSGIILFTFYKKDEHEILKNTKILNDLGSIKIGNQKLSYVCEKELLGALRNVEDSKKDLSEKQQDIINNKMINNMEKFIKSDVFKDLEKDFKLKDNCNRE